MLPLLHDSVKLTIHPFAQDRNLGSILDLLVSHYTHLCPSCSPNRSSHQDVLGSQFLPVTTGTNLVQAMSISYLVFPTTASCFLPLPLLTILYKPSQKRIEEDLSTPIISLLRTLQCFLTMLRMKPRLLFDPQEGTYLALGSPPHTHTQDYLLALSTPFPGHSTCLFSPSNTAHSLLLKRLFSPPRILFPKLDFPPPKTYSNLNVAFSGRLLLTFLPDHSPCASYFSPYISGFILRFPSAALWAASPTRWGLAQGQEGAHHQGHWIALYKQSRNTSLMT